MNKESYNVGDLYNIGENSGLGLVLEVYGNESYKVYCFKDKGVWYVSTSDWLNMGMKLT